MGESILNSQQIKRVIIDLGNDSVVDGQCAHLLRKSKRENEPNCADWIAWIIFMLDIL